MARPRRDLRTRAYPVPRAAREIPHSPAMSAPVEANPARLAALAATRGCAAAGAAGAAAALDGEDGAALLMETPSTWAGGRAAVLAAGAGEAGAGEAAGLAVV